MYTLQDRYSGYLIVMGAQSELRSYDRSCVVASIRVIFSFLAKDYTRAHSLQQIVYITPQVRLTPPLTPTYTGYFLPKKGGGVPLLLHVLCLSCYKLTVFMNKKREMLLSLSFYL
jgi:hypothetical protein